MAKEKGFGVLVDVLVTTKEVDSDSDSSVDESEGSTPQAARAARHRQALRLVAIKSHMVLPR